MNRLKSTRWMMLTALFLAAIWLPATSHTWLESAGIIHHHDHDGDEDHGASHEAADGCYRLQSTGVAVKAPTLFTETVLPILETQVVIVSPSVARVAGVPRTRGTSPPELFRRWQFTERAALPSRPPSFAG
jgi:hypothetical protein